MPKLLAVLALLAIMLEAPARPPDGPSGKTVQDEAPEWRAAVAREEREVARIERGVASGTESPQKLDDALHLLTEARAYLAEAEGRWDAAAREWRKVLACRERWIKRRNSHPRAEPLSDVWTSGYLAEVRCRLAEVERKPATLATELPKVIAWRERHLETIALMRKRGAYEAETTDEERAVREELRQLRLRLDAVKKQLREAGAAAKEAP